MTIIRLYADSLGNSYFEDVEYALYEADYAPPTPPILIGEAFDAERAILSIIKSEWAGDWHTSPCQQLYIQLAGEIEVETSDGERRRFVPGDVLLVEDTFGSGHKTRVVGDADARGMFVHLLPTAE